MLGVMKLSNSSMYSQKSRRADPPAPAGHGNLLELRHQQRAEQIGVFRAAQAFRQFRQKDFAAVHDVREVQPVLRLRHHVADRLAAEKILQPGQYRADGFVAGQLRKTFLPIIHHFRVPDGFQKFIAKRRFKQEPAQVGKRAAPAAFQKCQNCVLQNAIHLVAP